MASVRGAYPWIVLTLLSVVYSCNFMDRYIFIIMIDAIKHDLHLSDTQVGVLTGLAFSAVYSSAGLVVARWADRSNRRSIIALGLAAWSALTMVCGLTRSFAQLVFARMGVGVSESTCSPPGHSLLSDYFPPRRRALAFSIYTASGNYLGLGIGFVLGGWLGQHWGWRWAFIIGGLPGVLLAPAIMLVIREPKRGNSEQEQVRAEHFSLRDIGTYMLEHPSFLYYIAGAGMFCFATTALDNWGPLFLIRMRGIPTAQVGLWTGVLGASGGLLGGIISGWLADRWAARDVRAYLWVGMVAMAMTVPMTLLFLESESRLRIWVGYSLWAFFCSAGPPSMIALGQRLMPLRLRALSSAVLLLAYNIVGIAGCNLTIGILSDLWARTSHGNSLTRAMLMTQLAAVIGTVCTIRAIASVRRDFPEQFGMADLRGIRAGSRCA
jgi:MFS family permease